MAGNIIGRIADKLNPKGATANIAPLENLGNIGLPKDKVICALRKLYSTAESRNLLNESVSLSILPSLIEKSTVCGDLNKYIVVDPTKVFKESTLKLGNIHQVISNLERLQKNLITLPEIQIAGMKMEEPSIPDNKLAVELNLTQAQKNVEENIAYGIHEEEPWAMDLEKIFKNTELKDEIVILLSKNGSLEAYKAYHELLNESERITFVSSIRDSNSFDKLEEAINLGEIIKTIKKEAKIRVPWASGLTAYFFKEGVSLKEKQEVLRLVGNPDMEQMDFFSRMLNLKKSAEGVSHIILNMGHGGIQALLDEYSKNYSYLKLLLAGKPFFKGQSYMNLLRLKQVVDKVLSSEDLGSSVLGIFNFILDQSENKTINVDGETINSIYKILRNGKGKEAARFIKVLTKIEKDYPLRRTQHESLNALINSEYLRLAGLLYRLEEALKKRAFEEARRISTLAEGYPYLRGDIRSDFRYLIAFTYIEEGKIDEGRRALKKAVEEDEKSAYHSPKIIHYISWKGLMKEGKKVFKSINRIDKFCEIYVKKHVADASQASTFLVNLIATKIREDEELWKVLEELVKTNKFGRVRKIVYAIINKAHELKQGFWAPAMVFTNGNTKAAVLEVRKKVLKQKNKKKTSPESDLTSNPEPAS